MQTILGAGGAIGIPLASELRKYTDRVRLVGRNPKKVHESDELFFADLINREQVFKAVEGSSTVYLTAGLAYKLKAWVMQWPLVMDNVIAACIHHQARLVFFDNVYMYSLEDIPHMTEKSTMRPPSRKGHVRMQLVNMIMDAIGQGKLQALIARSADFYGPHNRNSALQSTVIDNLKKGKKPMWMSNATKIHSFTYTPDAARAVAQLGNTAEAFGQVWHLPTSTEKLTGEDFINTIAGMMGKKAGYSVLPRWACGLLGIFVPVLAELKEMMYQYELDYYFDSSKFTRHFGWSATPYTEGLAETIKTAY